jgi:hypothetical protein
MKNLTLTLPDDLYRKARSKAAAADTSLSRVVQDYVRRWVRDEPAHAELAARLDALFADSDARDQNKRGSAGPFGREDLYAGRLERFR